MIFITDLVIIQTAEDDSDNNSKGRRSKSALEDTMYERLLQILVSKEPVKLDHKYTKEDKRIYDVVKEGVYRVGDDSIQY